jgi:hypothetical protein
MHRLTAVLEPLRRDGVLGKCKIAFECREEDRLKGSVSNVGLTKEVI